MLIRFPCVSRVAHNNHQTQIIFTYVNHMTNEQLAKTMSEEQSQAVYAFMVAYWKEPGTPRSVWPLWMRQMYNMEQRQEGHDDWQIHQPHVFLSAFSLPQDMCM